VLIAGVLVVVCADVGVQEVDVQPLQLHRRQAGLERRHQPGRRLVRGRTAEIAFAGEAHARRRRPLESSADHRLAVPIERRGIDEVDPAVYRSLQGGDGFIAVGLAPQLAETAAAQSKPADGLQRAKVVGLHGVRPIKLQD